MRQRPRGPLRPNAEAIRRGLVFALDFAQADSPPWIGAAGAVIGGMASGAVVGSTPGGVGMVGANGKWGATGAGNTFTLPSEGTIIIRFTADHDSGTSVQRILAGIGNASFPTTPGVAISNFSGLWYAGWADGADRRLTVSSAGLYASGETVTTALTWDSAGQSAFMRGALIVSGAAAAYGDISGADFVLGDHGGFPFPFTQAAGAGLHEALIFHRALSVSEMAAHEADPWWWARRRGAASRAPATAVDLIGDPITTGAPVLGTPALGQIFALTGDAIAAGAPTLGTPALGQVFALTGDPLVTGAPVLGTPQLNAAPSASRTVRLPARDRLASLPARDRAVDLPPRRRTVTLQPERS